MSIHTPAYNLVTLSPTPQRSGSTIEVTIPGSKSFTNRALVAASFASSNSVLVGASPSDDTKALIAGLSALGITIGWVGNSLVIEPLSNKLRPYQAEIPFHGEIDVGPAGTSFRFLAAVLSTVQDCDVTLTGSNRLQERPVGPLVTALQQLGAAIDYSNRPSYPPLKIRGSVLEGGRVRIPGNVSSQFFTALLLIAARLPKGLVIEVDGELVSKSYLQMTFSTLAAFGVKVNNHNWRELLVEPGQELTGTTYNVEGDGSGATYFWALGALSGSPVRVSPLPSNSLQGDLRFPELLAEMGCKVTRGPNWIEVGPGKQNSHHLKAISADLEDLPDAAQTLAVVAACASGTSHLTGLRTLRIKETDRLAALVTELARVGINAAADADSITIHGGTPVATTPIKTYEDHRMAMSFAILASRIDGLQIEHPAVVSKSFPQFWKYLEASSLVGVDFS